MDDIAGRQDMLLRVLRAVTGEDRWTLELIESSGTGTAFAAVMPGRRLFVKWPAEVRPLCRLAELDIAPHVVATGLLGGLPFLVQEWVDGRAADRAWLRTHAADVMEVMHRYHSDSHLQKSLQMTSRVSAEQHHAEDLGTLRSRLTEAALSEFREPVVQQACSRFLDPRNSPSLNPLVVTHGDPNSDNMMLTAGGIRLIDWDGAEIADPLRDLGPLLWWFLPPEEWASALVDYGSPLAVNRRAIEWWAARASLNAALWIDAHGGDARSVRTFVDDFLAAESGVNNPHLED